MILFWKQNNTLCRWLLVVVWVFLTFVGFFPRYEIGKNKRMKKHFVNSQSWFLAECTREDAEVWGEVFGWLVLFLVVVDFRFLPMTANVELFLGILHFNSCWQSYLFSNKAKNLLYVANTIYKLTKVPENQHQEEENQNRVMICLKCFQSR